MSIATMSNPSDLLASSTPERVDKARMTFMDTLRHRRVFPDAVEFVGAAPKLSAAQQPAMTELARGWFDARSKGDAATMAAFTTRAGRLLSTRRPTTPATSPVLDMKALHGKSTDELRALAAQGSSEARIVLSVRENPAKYPRPSRAEGIVPEPTAPAPEPVDAESDDYKAGHQNAVDGIDIYSSDFKAGYAAGLGSGKSAAPAALRPEEVAERAAADWKANKGNCRATFINERTYIGFKQVEARGLYRRLG